MPRRTFDREAPFQSIRGAAEITGLAQGYIRAGCKSGTIPHVMCGQEYRVNIPLFLRQLDGESLERLKEAATKENRPSAATLERAEEAADRAAIPYRYSTTRAGAGQLKVFPQGEETL